MHQKVIPQETEVIMAKKIGISLDNETLELCDEYAEKTSHSRSEFIAKAIREYVSSIEVGRQKNIIAKILQMKS